MPRARFSGQDAALMYATNSHRPAVCVGRRMAICAHGAELGLRMPEALARKSIEDEGEPFSAVRNSTDARMDRTAVA